MLAHHLILNPRECILALDNELNKLYQRTFVGLS